MAKIVLLQSALNAGELSPLLRGRPSIPRYQNGLELCRNAIPLVTGGATRRPGKRHVALAKGSGAQGLKVAFIPFLLTLDGTLTGYLLELTNAALRFYKGAAQLLDGANPVEVVAPWLAAQLVDVTYEQNEGVLYLFHPAHAPRWLKRTSDTAWTLEVIPFVSYPYFRPTGTEAITIAPSAVGGNITLTASAAFFVAAHVGQKMKINGGLVNITAVTDATHASATVAEALPTGGLKKRTATIVVSPNIDEPPTPFSSATITVTADYNADSLATAITDNPSGAVIGITTAVETLTGTEATLTWEIQAWGGPYGWPGAVGFYEERLLAGYTDALPSGMWGSKSGEVSEFFAGALDDDPLAMVPALARTRIRHLPSTDQILVMTGTEEISLRGGNDSPLTPTRRQFRLRTGEGSSAVRPVMAGGEMIFVSPSGRNLHRFRYELENDRFVAPDLAILAAHLLPAGEGIASMAYSKRPHRALWIVTTAGSLLSLVYDQDQDVTAWAKHDSPALFKAVGVIPDAEGEDRIWLAEERQIDGSWQTLIGYLDAALNTDCAKTATGAASDTWAGFNHLEGEEVDVVADGYVYSPLPDGTRLTVAGGSITLPDAVTSIEAGFPYATTIKDLPPAMEGAAGAQVSCHGIRVLLHNTKGCTINGKLQTFQKTGAGVLDVPPVEFTGWIDVANLRGWDASGVVAQVEIAQTLPLPLTVLAIAKRISANEG